MTDTKMETRPDTDSGAGSPASQQVSWSACNEFLTAVLTKANVGPIPWAGTPAWCELPDNDPRKLLALADFGLHHALRIECGQAAMAESSREIAAAADWSAVARRRNDRGGAYIPRKAS